MPPTDPPPPAAVETVGGWTIRPSCAVLGEIIVQDANADTWFSLRPTGDRDATVRALAHVLRSVYAAAAPATGNAGDAPTSARSPGDEMPPAHVCGTTVRIGPSRFCSICQIGRDLTWAELIARANASARSPQTQQSPPVAGKLYAVRDIESLGEHYMRHLSAMTVEKLHSKSDIASELAWRDAEIERLKGEAGAVPAAATPVGETNDPKLSGVLPGGASSTARRTGDRSADTGFPATPGVTAAPGGSATAAGDAPAVSITVPERDSLRLAATVMERQGDVATATILRSLQERLEASCR